MGTTISYVCLLSTCMPWALSNYGGQQVAYPGGSRLLEGFSQLLVSGMLCRI